MRLLGLAWLHPSTAIAAGFLGISLLAAQQGKGGRSSPPESAAKFLVEVPDHAGSVVLGCPTLDSIVVVPIMHRACELDLVWAPEGRPLPRIGNRVVLAKSEGKRVPIDGLAADTRYQYEFRDPVSGARVLPADGPGSFRTARKPGSAFRFAVQADSHLDGSCSSLLYSASLANIAAGSPDFLVDLGDTFMTEKHPDRESAARQYTAQRYHFGTVAHSMPLFLALGNHDGERRERDGSLNPSGLAAWSLANRKRYFANPTPGSFYSGNPETLGGLGHLENYFAWEWGDALFVVLDPYWTSLPNRGGRSPWSSTLGQAQYAWLSKTLRASKRKFKFLFIHQLTGSYHSAGRGGSEAAAFQEWGGKELDGSDGFAAQRAGWEKPIHALLVECGVSVVFHGHDHFYARQELDGVVYQLVPQPAHLNARGHHAEEYGYKSGEFLPSSGTLRVSVTSESTLVEYVRSATPEMQKKGIRNGEIAATYKLEPASRPSSRPSSAR